MEEKKESLLLDALEKEAAASYTANGDVDDKSTLATLCYAPAHSPNLAASLGICYRWNGVTQSVDFERKLLLRALLHALPRQYLTLPPGCAALDDLDLAPVKVQPLLDMLNAQQPVDLGSTHLRWDVKQERPHFGLYNEAAEGGTLDAIPPFGGLSKRQLELAAFEALLIATGGGGDLGVAVDSGGADADRASVGEALACVSARLGIDEATVHSLRATLQRAARASPARTSHQGELPPPSAASELDFRLAMVRANYPADFRTDTAFYDFLERQAAIIGAACHMLLHAHAASEGYEDMDECPAGGLCALIDALFMELLTLAQPSAHCESPRRSEGFNAADFAACAERIEGLIRAIGELDPERDDVGGGAAAAAVLLPPQMRAYLHMVILSCRFNKPHDEDVSLAPGAMALVHCARSHLAGALSLTRCEHLACLAHSAACELQRAPQRLLPRLAPAIARPIHHLKRAVRDVQRASLREARRGEEECGAVEPDDGEAEKGVGGDSGLPLGLSAWLLRPISRLVLHNLLDLRRLMSAPDQPTLACLFDLFGRIASASKPLLRALTEEDPTWAALTKDCVEDDDEDFGSIDEEGGGDDESVGDDTELADAAAALAEEAVEEEENASIAMQSLPEMDDDYARCVLEEDEGVPPWSGVAAPAQPCPPHGGLVNLTVRVVPRHLVRLSIRSNGEGGVTARFVVLQGVAESPTVAVRLRPAPLKQVIPQLAWAIASSIGKSYQSLFDHAGDDGVEDEDATVSVAPTVKPRAKSFTAIRGADNSSSHPAAEPLGRRSMVAALQTPPTSSGGALVELGSGRPSRGYSVSSHGSDWSHGEAVTLRGRAPSLRALPSSARGAMLALVELAAERLYENLVASVEALQTDAEAAPRTPPEGGAAFLRELSTRLRTMAVLLARRMGPTLAAAAPSLVPRPSAVALRVVCHRLRQDVEVHAVGTPLASPDTRKLLSNLSALQILLGHAEAGYEPVRSGAALLDARAIVKLFDAWARQQRDAFNTVLQGSFQHETWEAVAQNQRISSSLVDLFQCFSQSVEVFLTLAQPCPSFHGHVDRLLDEIVRAMLGYAQRIRDVIGDEATLSPPMRPLWRLVGPQSSGSARRRAADNAMSPALAERLRGIPMRSVCQMANNLFACEERLAKLWDGVLRGWRRVVGATEDGALWEAQQFALTMAQESLGEELNVVVSHVATRLVCHTLRNELAASLYAESASEPPNQLAAVLPSVADAEARLLANLRPELAPRLARSVLRAMMAELDRLLLDGGRAFSLADGEILAEDAQALLDYFCMNVGMPGRGELTLDEIHEASEKFLSTVALCGAPVSALITEYLNGDTATLNSPQIARVAEAPPPKSAAATLEVEARATTPASAPPSASPMNPFGTASAKGNPFDAPGNPFGPSESDEASQTEATALPPPPETMTDTPQPPSLYTPMSVDPSTPPEGFEDAIGGGRGDDILRVLAHRKEKEAREFLRRLHFVQGEWLLPPPPSPDGRREVDSPLEELAGKLKSTTSWFLRKAAAAASKEAGDPARRSVQPPRQASSGRFTPGRR